MFRKKKPKIEGYIGYYNLQDWWLELSETERALIEETFAPNLGTSEITLTQGKLKNSSHSVGEFLNILAGWFERKDLAPIGLKILNQARPYCIEPLEKHFWYGKYIELRYKQRDDAKALDEVIDACEDMVDLAPRAAMAFKGSKSFGRVPPSHIGYKQLIVIRKKQGNKAEADRLREEYARIWS